MTDRYVISCGACGESAPLTGHLLSGISAQVTAFQAAHGRELHDFAVELVPVATPVPHMLTYADSLRRYAA
jgi:hypothetical protein